MTKRKPTGERQCAECGHPTTDPNPHWWRATDGIGLCLMCRKLPHRKAQADDYAREHGPAVAVSSEPSPTRGVVRADDPPPPDDLPPPTRRVVRPRDDQSPPAPPHSPPPAPPEHDADPAKRAKVPALISLDALESRPITWLWPGWIPAGMLSICDGLPGEGKSTMLVDIAARVTTGRDMPDGSPGVEPGGVLFLSFEDAPREILKPRFEAAGAYLPLVHVHRPESDDLLMLGKGSPLERWIIEHGAKLVVIDPLLTAVPGGADMHKGQDTRRLLATVTRTAEQTGAAIIGVRHFTKGEGRSALLRGEGSIGISGTARSVFVVARDPDAPDDPTCRVLARSKGNLGAPPTSQRFALVGWPDDPEVPRVDWRGESRRAADDLTGPSDDEQRGALDDAIAVLRIELGDGPKPAREIMAAARAAGVAPRTLTRARKVTGVRSHKTPGGWVLSLPAVAERPEHLGQEPAAP